MSRVSFSYPGPCLLQRSLEMCQAERATWCRGYLSKVATPRVLFVKIFLLSSFASDRQRSQRQTANLHASACGSSVRGGKGRGLDPGSLHAAAARFGFESQTPSVTRAGASVGEPSPMGSNSATHPTGRGSLHF